MALPDWSPEALDAVIESNELVLVDLRAEWCGQCGPQERVLERMLPDLAGRVVVGSVDVGRHVAVADRYEVRTLPALLLFRDGALADRVVGFARAPRVRSALAGIAAGT